MSEELTNAFADDHYALNKEMKTVVSHASICYLRLEKKIENTLKQLPKTEIRAARLIFCRKSTLSPTSPPLAPLPDCSTADFYKKSPSAGSSRLLVTHDKAHCRTQAEKDHECVVKGMAVFFTVSSL